MVEDESGLINAVWFNQPYLEKNLPPGTEVSLAGKATLDKRGLYLSSPSYERFLGDSQLVHTSGLVPVYPETEKLSSRYLRFLIKPLLAGAEKLPDPLPEELIKKYNLPKMGDALRDVHFPQKAEDAKLARQRFALEELLLFQLRVLRDHRQLQTFKAPRIDFDKKLISAFVGSLPFELTNDQRVAAYEILQDLGRSYPMNRLLNGDVGSGKTVVALIAAYQAVSAGYQAVFMAPTEILAEQHFQTMRNLLSRDSKSKIRIGLLTGSGAKPWPDEKVTKKILRDRIADGGVDIIIGTHAVIQRSVRFKNLGLVVIDEQHRFGVEQRAALARGSAQMNTQINADNKNSASSKLLYEDLTYRIRGALFNVYNKLGGGHKEIIYHKALEEEFKNQDLNFETEKLIPVRYGSKKVGDYKPDFVVEGRVVLELKALPFIGKLEDKQLRYYLKGSEYKLGLLVNFGDRELQIKRVIYDSIRNQRQSASNLRESALVIPHLLSMTATPIPRTLALTIFGDLDISLLKEKPKGRQAIVTKVVPGPEREKAHRFIEDEIQKGRQAFVICPRIEVPDSGAGLQSAETGQLSFKKLLWAEVKAVTEEHKKLAEKVFPHRRVAMLHGRMKSAEKNRIMGDFKDGRCDILVSTSVVEVGVDIPNASIMMIESAERFGLAQLHQFRGRVGRGEHQSYCLLFTGSDVALANQRLGALEETDNGFELAEMDLKIRGPGEFGGVKQSGIPDFAMTSLADVDLIKKARLEARLLLKEDPTLKSRPLLLGRLAEMQRVVHFE
jgi:ATP-dependent DNA helicase RecG